MEINRPELKSVSVCLAAGFVHPQLTVLAVRVWITRTTAAFPPDSGPALHSKTHLIVLLWARDEHVNNLDDFLMQPIAVC